MVDASSPLLVEAAEVADELRIFRQAPPASAASFSVSLVALGGHAFDPPGREGTAFLLNDLIGSGAGRLPRVQFARELDRLGATLSSRTAPESLEVTVWGPEAARERILDLWALSVTQPRLDPDDLARARRHLLERQLRETSQPDSRAERELFRAIFPKGHPYRETGVGTEASVRRITRADVRSFHHRQFARAGAIVVGTTRLGAREFRRSVARRLERLPSGPAPSSPTAVVVRSPQHPVHRLLMRGRSQVEVRMGGPSIPRGSPSFPAAFLANEVLGGRPLLSRLFQVVREEHGLAYDSSSEIDAMRWGGVWQAHAGTGPERTPKVVQLLQREIDRLRNAIVPEVELDRIRESSIGQIPLSLETTSGAHELAVDVAYHGLPGDFYARWPTQLRAIRPREIRDAARRAFDPKYAVTVIAGPGKV